MKIQNQYKVLQNNSTVKAGKKREVDAGQQGVSSSSSHVELSDSAGFVQALKEAAEQVEPQSVRHEVVEQAKRDIREGKLGSKEDYEQAINALFSESND